MQHANVNLSEKELQLVANTEIILTKNIIIQKVYQLFGIVSNQYKTILDDRQKIPAEVLVNSPKIYKGENYHGLPYVMLDYPRFFNKSDAMSIRSFFWWGNFFSITIHLSGKYKINFLNGIMQYINTHAQNDWFICINEDQWQHHFENGNYIACNAFNGGYEMMENFLTEHSFIKLSKKMDVKNWSEAQPFFKNNFEEILNMLSVNC